MAARAAKRLPLASDVEQRTIHVYAALAALERGEMQPDQFRDLADFFDWFRCLGEIKGKRGATILDGANTGLMAMENIRHRWEQTDKIEADDDERQVLGILAVQMEQAMRMTLMDTLNRAHSMMEKQRKKLLEQKAAEGSST